MRPGERLLVQVCGSLWNFGLVKPKPQVPTTKILLEKKSPKHDFQRSQPGHFGRRAVGTVNPKAKTLNPKPKTLNPKP